VTQFIIIVVYMLLMALIGVFSIRKARDSESFFILGRKGSTAYITGSLIATIIGASATLGMAGFGFTRGLTGVWWLLVGSIGLLILGIFLAERVRKLMLYTLPGLASRQYGKAVGITSSILIVLAWLGVIAGQIVAAGKILGILGMGSPVLWMIIFTGIFVFYTVLGGQYGAIRTDLIQAIIIYVGIFGGLGLLIARLGGWNSFTTSLPAAKFDFPLGPGFDFMNWLSYLLIIGLTYVVGPDMYSRLFCAKDANTAKKAAIWTAVLLIPIAFAIVLIGMGASVLSPDAAAEQAFPLVIQQVLPPLMSGIVLAALVSAVMSSADTCLLSVSIILTRDILKPLKPKVTEKQLVLATRWLIVAVGVASLLLALYLKGIITSLLYAYTIYTCGITIPIIFGFFKEKLHLTSAGALIAMIGGGSAGLISKIFAVKYLDLWGLVICFALLFGVSFIQKRLTGSNGMEPAK
jgi:solute:Na+ symporter, SSS family